MQNDQSRGRCTKHMQSFPCTGCIADSKARDDEAPMYQAPVIDADQRDVNERGIRRVRAALGQTPVSDDKRAAGDDD